MTGGITDTALHFLSTRSVLPDYVVSRYRHVIGAVSSTARVTVRRLGSGQETLRLFAVHATHIFDGIEIWRIKMKNNNPEAVSATHQLRYLATDLHEVYSLLNELSSQLEGGGIVQVRDVEPTVSMAVPKLRSAVAALYAASQNEEIHGEQPAGVNLPSQNPLLM